MSSTISRELTALVPTARHLGADVLEARAGRARVRFEAIPELLDGSGHLKPAALLALGKTASASALLSLLGGRAATASITVAGANARSSRTARGSLIAEAEVVGFREATLRDFDRTGSSTIRVSISIEDDSERPVSELFVDWHVHAGSEEVRRAA